MADTNYSSNSTLLHFDDTNGSTSITDNGPVPKSYTAYGNAAISTTQSVFGGSSLSLDGNGDYIETPQSSDFAFPGDFTIAFRAWKSGNGTAGYDTACTTDTSNGSAVNGWTLELSSSRGFCFIHANTVVISYSTNPNDSAWHAWAVCRSGRTIALYKDGTQVATATYASAIVANGSFGIGGSSTLTTYGFSGYIDELRIVKGVALYTGNYTVETSAYENSSGAFHRLNALVGETSTTTGTGPLTLSGALTDHRTFASCLSVDNTTEVMVRHESDGSWAHCYATYTGTNELTLTTTVESSTGSAISWAAGNKTVIITPLGRGLGVVDKLLDLESPGNLDRTAFWEHASNMLKSLSWSNLKTSLKAYFDTLYVTTNAALGTPTSGTLTNCTADGTNLVGFRSIPQNSQSTAYTLVIGDAGKHLLHPSADTTARTFTIPANSSVAFPVGTAVTFINQNGGGTITISITTDTLRLAGPGTTGSRTLYANGIATAVKVTSTEWLICGTGLT